MLVTDIGRMSASREKHCTFIYDGVGRMPAVTECVACAGFESIFLIFRVYIFLYSFVLSSISCLTSEFF